MLNNDGDFYSLGIMHGGLIGESENIDSDLKFYNFIVDNKNGEFTLRYVDFDEILEFKHVDRGEAMNMMREDIAASEAFGVLQSRFSADTCPAAEQNLLKSLDSEYFFVKDGILGVAVFGPEGFPGMQTMNYIPVCNDLSDYFGYNSFEPYQLVLINAERPEASVFENSLIEEFAFLECGPDDLIQRRFMIYAENDLQLDFASQSINTETLETQVDHVYRTLAIDAGEVTAFSVKVPHRHSASCIVSYFQGDNPGEGYTMKHEFYDDEFDDLFLFRYIR